MKKTLLLVAFSICNAPFALANDSWTIDPMHSVASFSVRHMMISNVKGRFGKMQGSASYNGSDLKDARVNATIDVSSVDTGEPKRDGHLKSPDFFDVSKFPAITFSSKAVIPTKAGFDIKGDLSMHGVTKPVVLHAEKLSPQVKDPYGNIRIGTSAITKINRKDFGVSFNQQMDNGGALVGDDVDIALDIEMIKDKDKTAQK
jgi:polyisoprenoid-binding protein YceI